MALAAGSWGGWRDVISSTYAARARRVLTAGELMGGSLSSFSTKHKANSYRRAGRVLHPDISKASPALQILAKHFSDFTKSVSKAGPPAEPC